MHMADALISPAVGGAMWAATGGLTVYCARKLKDDLDERRVPLMGVLGAFVFSAQMINFSIPGTGSSGHLGGGLLLAVLLGPHAGFLTIASVLIVQALFFADGGLLALGCNVINLGLFPCFVAYPLVYRRLAGAGQGRMALGAVLGAVVGLQLGALGVILQTMASGISDLPFATFVLFMLPIHLAIGIVEGLVTAAVLTFVSRARPEILDLDAAHEGRGPLSAKGVAVVLAVVAVVTGGVLSWFASSHPDGLEWSLARATGSEELAEPEGGVFGWSAEVQEKTALLPDYDFRQPETEDEAAEEEAPAVMNAGASVSGVVGALLTLLLAGALAVGLRARNVRG